MRSELTRRLLNAQEAAELLNIGVPTLLQKRPDIVKVHIGRRVLYDPEDLWAYVEAHKSFRTTTPNSKEKEAVNDQDTAGLHKAPQRRQECSTTIK